MTGEELISEVDRLFGHECYDKCSECGGCQIKDTFDEVKKALEKQIPKVPRFYNCNYYCPTCDDLVGCHDTIMKWDNKFCKECGQAIKWE